MPVHIESTTDSPEVVKAVAAAKTAVNFEGRVHTADVLAARTEEQVDYVEGERGLSASYEDPQSERLMLEQRLAEAKQDLKPTDATTTATLTRKAPESESAKPDATEQPEQSTESSEQTSEQQLQPTDYDRILSMAAEKGNLEVTAETLDRISYPDTPQLAAVNAVMTAVLQNEVEQKHWAPVVHALLSNPESVGKLETAQSSDDIVNMVRETAKHLRLGEIKQRYAAPAPATPQPVKRNVITPMKPVGGGVRAAKSITDPDISYADYRKLRSEQIRANRRH